MNTILRHFALPALAAGALLSALPAHAVGRLVDINLIDRDSGESLPVYRHQGQYWVAGRPGARYAVSVRNALPGRIMGVVSVDGVNVVSGQTAAWHQTGYVLGPWQQYDISGWRKTDSEVAAFHFTALPSSYAARTGRPAHVGVIGVAVFRERVPVAWAPRQRMANEAGDAKRAEAPMAAPAEAQAGAGATTQRHEAAAAPSAESAMKRRDDRLGTGHGRSETSWVTRVNFDRATSSPEATVAIRYDRHEALVARGIVPGPRYATRVPSPFPAWPGFVPDPR